MDTSQFLVITLNVKNALMYNLYVHKNFILYIH